MSKRFQIKLTTPLDPRALWPDNWSVRLTYPAAQWEAVRMVERALHQLGESGTDEAALLLVNLAMAIEPKWGHIIEFTFGGETHVAGTHKITIERVK
jgi:hypothetical protein